MTEQEQKTSETLDAENLSDEELNEVAGGIVQSASERKRIEKLYKEHIANGGTLEGWKEKRDALKQSPWGNWKVS